MVHSSVLHWTIYCFFRIFQCDNLWHLLQSQGQNHSPDPRSPYSQLWVIFPCQKIVKFNVYFQQIPEIQAATIWYLVHSTLGEFKIENDTDTDTNCVVVITDKSCSLPLCCLSTSKNCIFKFMSQQSPPYLYQLPVYLSFNGIGK